MLLVLKSFFRKKTSILYFIIFSILVTALFILSLFINYYKKLNNKLYYDNSIAIIVAQNDYYDKLKSYDSITNITPFLMFYPDRECNTFGDENMVIYDEHGNLIMENINSTDLTLNWEDFIIGGTDFIIVNYPKEENNINPKDSEIYLPIYPSVYSKESLFENLESDISFIYNENKEEFDIVGHFYSSYPYLLISHQKFTELLDDQKLFAYTFNITDFYESEKIVKELEELENNDDFLVLISESYNNNDNDTFYNLKNLINILNIVNIVIIAIILIIVIIIIKNIIKDEEKNIKIEKVVGFNKYKMKLLLFIQIFSLIIFALIISLIFSSISAIIINNIFDFELELFNFNSLLILLLITFLITFLSCYSYKA